VINARLVSALVFSILILIADSYNKKSPPPGGQVITLAPTNVPVFEEWIGTLDGFVNAQIRAQVRSPNHALQRTRRERRGCNPCVPGAGSLSLGRK
jgi:hypothetical protein